MSNAKGAIAFLIFAFGLAWISWAVPVRMGVPVTAPVCQLSALPGAFAPAIAAALAWPPLVLACLFLVAIANGRKRPAKLAEAAA
jgi:hypothetical protein